jgi:translation initiation factor 3 subunit K
MQRPAEVEAAFKVDKRYSVESLPVLVKHLDSQLKSGSYDLEANLAILKLMLIHPTSSDAAVIRKVLMKAVLFAPNGDFQLCMYQIPDRLHKTDELKRLVDLAHLLEMAKFQQFWREAEAFTDLNAVSGWREKIRAFIVDVVALTYQSIDMKDFCELLNLKGKEADAKKLVKEHGLELKGETILIKQEEAAPVESAQPQQLTLDQLKKVLVSVR